MTMCAARVTVAAILACGISSKAQAQSSPATRSALNLPHASGVITSPHKLG